MNDVGYSDKTVVSPTIDAFAAGGIKLTNLCAYLPLLCSSAQLSFLATLTVLLWICRLSYSTDAYKWCAPSRATFMTGRYVPMHGFEESSDGGGSGVNGTGPSPAVPLRFRFLPQTLQLANYSCSDTR